ncbi:MAG TPA: T9SS type A sorting domain-containing protein [Bacteroidales bacterium]|nr:T9SS type A sorting domain-containing protein [Bacteroidales bacterium]HSA43202.1 T9SS type A sorting domain-containing protein [Bacteroidales bacterium]
MRQLQVFVLFLVMILVKGNAQQFQQELLTESNGIIGRTADSAGNSLYCISLNPGFGLLRENGYAQPVSYTVGMPADNLYISAMKSLQDGGSLLLGQLEGKALTIRLDDLGGLKWARKIKTDLPESTVSFLNLLDEDAAGNLYLGGYHVGIEKFFIQKWSPGGNLLWTRRSSSGMDERILSVKLFNDGYLYLAGQDAVGGRIWIMDTLGGMVSSFRIQVFPEVSMPVVDIFQPDDEYKLLLLQSGPGVVFDAVLTRLDQAWLTDWAYRYTSGAGFRSVETVFMANGNYCVAANAVNPDFPQDPYPPYHALMAEIESNGSVVKAMRYHGDHKYAGMSGHDLTAGQGHVLFGSANETGLYPFRPWIVRTDDSLMSACFEDSVQLHPLPVNLWVIPEMASFSTPADTLQGLNFSLLPASIPPHQNLCYSGINEVLATQHLELFPNPVAEYLNFRISPAIRGMISFEITDVSGRTVMSDCINTVSSMEGVSLIDIQSGCYLLIVHFPGGVASGKFIKL